MLRITNEQFAVFETAADRRHAIHLAKTLAATHPGRLPEGHEAAFVTQSIAEARTHGLAQPQDIDAFVEASLLMGPGFIQHPDLPWAQAVLHDTRPAKGHRLLELARIVLLPQDS